MYVFHNYLFPCSVVSSSTTALLFPQSIIIGNGIASIAGIGEPKSHEVLHLQQTKQQKQTTFFCQK